MSSAATPTTSTTNNNNSNMLAPEAVKRRLGFHHRRERSHDGFARLDRERVNAAATSGPRARLRAVLEGQTIDLVLHEFSGGFPLTFTATTEGRTHHCHAAGPGDLPCKMVIELPKNISCRFPRVALACASKAARGGLTLTIDEYGVDGWCALTPLAAPSAPQQRARSLSDSSLPARKHARAGAKPTSSPATNAATTASPAASVTKAASLPAPVVSQPMVATMSASSPPRTAPASPGPALPRTPQPTRAVLAASPPASPATLRAHGTATPPSTLGSSSPLVAAAAGVLERQFAAASLKAAAAEHTLHTRQMDQLRKSLGDEIADLRRRLRDAEDIASEAARQHRIAERRAAVLHETVTQQAQELKDLRDQARELHELAAAAELDEASSVAGLRAENEWLREQLQRCAEVLRTAHVTALMKGALGRVRKVRTELAGPGQRCDATDSDDASASTSQSPVHLPHVHVARMSLFTRQDSGHDSSGQQSPACSGRTSPLEPRSTLLSSSTPFSPASPITPRPRHASRAKEHSLLTIPRTDVCTPRVTVVDAPSPDGGLSLADDLRFADSQNPHPCMLSSPAPPPSAVALVAETDALQHQLNMLATSLAV